MEEIKKDSIDISEKEKSQYYFRRDIIIVMPNDTLYSADAYILDVINAKSYMISDDDRLMLESMLYEIYDNKAICPEISIMKSADGKLKLRSEDPYKPNMSNIDLIAILVKTKKQHIITRPAWEYMMSRYPNITDGVLPSTININMSTYYEGDNNYFLVDTLNMPYDEKKLIGFINPLMVSRIITVDNGESVFNKLAFETTTELQNKVMLTLVTPEIGNIDLIPILFNIWFTNDKALNLILEHIDYSITIVQDSIVNAMQARNIELMQGDGQDILPYTLVDLWNPNLAQELEVQNYLMEMQQKIQKKDKYI
jgi:hypothetical protein